ncbi:MAG: hypothetical protein ACYC69_17270 [Thermodesulfovibrionales bacterium]
MMQNMPKPATGPGPAGMATISRISPETVNRVKLQYKPDPVLLLDFDGIITTAHQTRQALTNGVNGVEQTLYGTKARQEQFSDKLRLCSTRPYTRDDQLQAGCQGSDTLSQCEDKLIAQCVKYERENVIAVHSQLRQKASVLKGELPQWTLLMQEAKRIMEGFLNEAR